MLIQRMDDEVHVWNWPGIIKQNGVRGHGLSESLPPDYIPDYVGNNATVACLISTKHCHDDRNIVVSWGCFLDRVGQDFLLCYSATGRYVLHLLGPRSPGEIPARGGLPLSKGQRKGSILSGVIAAGGRTSTS
jgi:hypothetical protein